MSKSEAIDQLTSLIGQGVAPKRLDEVHDLLKLLGLVLGQFALLEVAVDRDADEKARVSAARALVSIKENPDQIAERLRRSPFSDLTVAQLETIVQQVKQGKTDLYKLVEQTRQQE